MARLASVLGRRCAAWRRAGWGGPLILALAVGLGALWTQFNGDVIGADASVRRAAAHDVQVRHRREIVFVDGAVSDREALLRAHEPSDSTRSFEVIWLDQASDGVAQVTTALAKRTGIDAVHILSHGQEGGFTIGTEAQANSSGVANPSQSTDKDVRNDPPTSGGPLTGAARATRGGFADKKGAHALLVDRLLPDSTLIARAVTPGGRVFLYDSAHESAAHVLSRVVTWAAAAEVQVASLSILSHGTPGAFELGDQWITTTSAALTTEVWRALSDVLAPQARINLFGCNVAAPGSNGPRLLDELALLTGADVFASDDVTGRGGDWELEVSSSGAAHDIAASGPPPLNVALLESANVSLAWYNPNWGYRKQITIDHTRVSGGADLTNFPVLVNLSSDANLAANAQANGNDILFTSADGTTKLSHEIETYTSATGALIAWVKVPILSASVDTVLYIYYGNVGAADQQNPTAVWDANYHGVWHLKENAVFARDSTSNANNATSGTLPTQTAGPIGYGLAFDGSTQTVGIPNAASLNIPTNGTFSVWFKFDVVRQSDLFEKGGTGGYTAWQLNSDLWWGPQYGSVGQWSSTVGLATGQWYRLDGVSQFGIQKLYLNGTLAAQSSQTSNFLNTGTLQLGNGVDGLLDGSLDEFRISDVVRSDGWIRTEYNNQSSPGTFLAVAAGESLTVIGNGTDPGNVSLAPGGAATAADTFTFQTSAGTDTITAVTVTLAAGTSGGLSVVEITNDAGTTVYGSLSDPASDTPVITLATNITATTTATQYKIRVTPKSHTAMPAPAGSTYSVTAVLSDWTGTNGHAGTDPGSATVTIDNLSPGNVTGSTATAGSTQVALGWTNPGDADLGTIVVLRSTSAVAEVPAEGATYVVGDTINAATVACVVASPGTSCTDTGLTNGTAYHYKVFTQDTNRNYATGVVPTGSPATPTATTLGTGIDPGNASLAPGGAATPADAFTFVTSTGTDTITAVTVTLAAGTSGGLSVVEITNDAGTVVYGSVANPASDTPVITLTTPLTATTTATPYLVRVTPKSHAAMPAPAGSTYSVTASISAWTGTNAHAGSDSGGTTVTIDNLSPGNVTGSTATAGAAQVALSWTNPADVDLGSLIVLRRAGTAVGDTPTEGATYVVGNTLGASTVACVVASPGTTCTDTGLTNGTVYHYKIFAKDTSGNYATGVVPTGSPATPFPIADLSVTKTDGVASVNAGGMTTYTVVVSNAGPSAADGATLTDPAVAGLSKTGVSCAASGGAVCPASPTVAQVEAGLAIPTLPSGGSVTFTITATITATSGSVSNVASVAPPAATMDPAAGNNSATDTDTVTPVADLSLTKTDGVASVNAGGTTTYTVVVSNAGPSAADGATLSDPAATGLSKTGVSCAASGGAVCPASPTVAQLEAGLAIPTLPGGGTITLTLTATVTATGGSVSNVATVAAPGGVTDPDVANNTATDTDTVTPVADLSITKTNGVTSLIAGATTTYTIVVTNLGPSPVTGAAVSDPAPAGLTFGNWTCAASAGSMCPASGSGNIAATIDLLPGGTATFTMPATVGSTTTGTLTNTATVTVPAGVTDPAPSNNTASDSDPVSPAPPVLNADLGVAKTNSTASVGAGATTTYAITVSNAGPSAADGAVVTDPVVAGLTKTGVSCTASGGAVCPASPTVAQVESGLAIPTLPSSGSVTLTITATVTATAGSVSNVASAAPPAGTTDPAAGNNSATDTDAVGAVADVSVTKTDGVASVNAGGTTTYTVVVTNAGPSAADGAVMTDPAVAGLSKMAVTCVAAGGAVCPTSPTVAQVESGLAVPTLPSGGNVTFTITATVTATGGSVSNVATVAAPAGTTDPSAANNTATDADAVGAVADLSVTKTDGVASVNAGSTTTYAITVLNAGPSAAGGAGVSDPVAVGLTKTAVTCVAAGVAVCPASPSVAQLESSLAIPTLPSGGSVTFSVTATVTATGGSISNVASVAAPGGVTDPDAANNAATDTDTVSPAAPSNADLTITNTNGVTALTSGATATYTIVVTNLGPAAADGAVVTNPAVPGLTGLTVGCAATGGAVCPPSPTIAQLQAGLAIPTLPASDSLAFSVTARVTATSGAVTSTASIAPPAGVTDPNSANNTATDSDTIEPQRVGVANEAGTPVVVAPNAFEVRFTIVAANVGTVPLTNLQVTDLLSQAFLAGGPAVSISGPVVASPSGGAAAAQCAVNPAFTGLGMAPGTTTNLLAGSGTLAPNQACTLQFTLRITYQDAKSIPSATQYNSATARTYAAPPVAPGALAAGSPLATDDSDSGTSPTGTNPGAPGDTGGSDDPTPVRLAQPRVDITNALREVQQVDDTTFDVGFTFVVKNTGEVSIRNVQVTDDLAATFSAGQPVISIQEGPTAGGGDATLTFAQDGNAYNGTTQLAMLTGTDTLPPGAEGWIIVKVRVRYPSPSAIPAGQELKNTATATTAMTPGGVVVGRDDSTDVTETGASPARGDIPTPTILRIMPWPRLTADKTASVGTAEIGDSVLYSVRVRNAGGPFLPETTLYDRLPLGFRYIAGTAGMAMGGATVQAIADPAGGAGPVLAFTIAPTMSSAEAVLTYRLRVGPGALQGDGINTAEAVSGTERSNLARARVVVTGGVFTTDASVAGKIFVDCNGNRVQDLGELGIPGVRVVFEDGTALVSDVEGKYSYSGLSPSTHVLKVDRTTLPVGSRLMPSSNRNAGDGGSLFVDLKFGELHRVDFVEGSCSERVLGQVKARRSRGEIWVPILDGTDAGVSPVRGRDANQTVPLPATAQVKAQAPATLPSSDRPSLFVPLDQAAGLSSTTSNLPVTGPDALNQAQARAARVELRVDRDAAPADGQTAVEVTLRVLDESGAPVQGSVVVTVEASGGHISLPGRPTDQAGTGRGDEGRATEGTQVRVDHGVSTFQIVAAANPQDASIRATAGRATGQVVIAFVPHLRPMLVAGLVEGMVGLTKVDASALAPARPNEAFDRELRRFSRSFDDGQGMYGGRAALFLKGTVSDNYLLTLAYDSEKDSRGVLFRDIQPEAFYPVYGDSSLKGFDAQTSGRFYARVDRGRSFLLYGDLQTATARSEARNLGIYSRTLTGLQQHFETPRMALNAFGSRGTLKQVVDEFAGLGVSGPYSVSNPNGVSGTEKVEIITRDRNQPAVILSTVPMTRFADYEFEPFSGRLIFRRPVPAADEHLNPVSIRITYEVDQGGEAYWVGGFDGQVKLGGHLEVGGSWNEDRNPLAPYRLSSVSAIARLGRNTSVVAEGARTTSTVNTTAVNAVGSANLAQVAGEVEGNAARVELRHESRRLQVRLFAGTSDPGFNNPAASLNGGRAEAGARGALHFSDSLHLVGEAIHSEDRLTGGERDGAVLTVESQLSRVLRVEFGVRRAKETRRSAQGITLGTTLFSSASGSGFGFQSAARAIDPVTGLSRLNAGLTPVLSAGANASQAAESLDVLTLRAKMTVKFGKVLSLYGEGEQDVRDSDKKVAAVGGEYRIKERTRVYARHEFISSLDGPYALNSQQRSYHTVFGVSSSYMKDGDLFSEYRVRDAFSGREAEAAIGLRNLWTLAQGVRLSTGLERLHAVSGLDQTATAASVGLEYTRHPLFKGTGRVEWRHDPSSDSWLSTVGVAHKVARDWTLLAKNYYQLTSPKQAGDQVQNRFWAGAAFRDTDTNKLDVLSRYEFKYEKMPGLLGVATDQRVHIVSTHADYHPLRDWMLTGQYGAKWIDDRTDPAGSRLSAHLVSGRVGYDLSKRWDVGGLASVLWSHDGGRQYALGGEVGYLLRDNLWLSAGYNVIGFNDRDLSGGNYTARGAFVRLRVKIDEEIFRRSPSKKGK